MEIALQGIGVSPGIAIGPVVTFRVQPIEVPRFTIDDPQAEIRRFDAAVERVREALTKLRDQIAEDVGTQHAAIFKSHLEILDDPALRPEIESRIKAERLNAEFLVDDLVTRYARMLDEVEDPLFRERSADFVDVGKRILGALLERELQSLEHLKEPSVVVARELTPSETANMDMTHTLGLATDGGGPTSHMAILARAFEIPAVVGLRYVGSYALPGDTIIVDGALGRVILRPTEQTLARYRKEKTRLESERRALIQAEPEGPSVTLDGVEVPTLANIELPVEAALARKVKCQGIGLYRTEYLYMNRRSMPTEEDQYRAYKHVLETMAPWPVTIRTLDIGGDKMVTYLHGHKEENPQLGWRSIRFCLDRPDIFKAQLRALFRASVHGALQIMFPMITGVDELREVMTIVRQVKDDLDGRRAPYNKTVKLGTMIEVPASAAIADMLARECDFFSIGTNDLIQYCLAVDRVNERTAHLYEPAHPGVLRLIKQTVDAAKKVRIPCSICGEMAGDPTFTELLLGLGLDSLSMSSVSIPVVRWHIANIRVSTAKRFVRRVLNTPSVAEIKALLAQRRNAIPGPKG